MNIEAAQIVLSCTELKDTLPFFTERLGRRTLHRVAHSDRASRPGAGLSCSAGESAGLEARGSRFRWAAFRAPRGLDGNVAASEANDTLCGT